MTDLRLKLASTLPALKLQIATPRLQCRTTPFFPGSVVGGAGIDITSIGGTFTVSWNAIEAGFSAFGMQLGAATNAGAAREILGLTINVKDFGAVGDGVTDDTTAIMAAIAAADAFTVATLPSITSFISAAVYFPSGNYLHAGITSTKPHRFFGDGKGATFLKLKNGANTSFWTHTIPGTGAGPTINYFQQPIFQDMTWDCNGANQSAGTSVGMNLPSTAWTITTLYSVGAFIDRMEIYNAKHQGINIGANRNFGIVKDTTIKGCGDKGIANAAYDWRIYAIDIGSCLYGYSQDAAGGTTFWGGNIYFNTEAGINISAGVNTYVWFDGMSIDLNQKYGAIVNGNNDQETFMVSFNQCRFMGNSALTNNTYADILATNCYGLSVSNCQFYAQGANRPPYALQTSGGGPVLWSNNHYRTAGGTQPWATALTNDFTKLQVVGDRKSVATIGSDGDFDFFNPIHVRGTTEFFTGFTAEEIENGANPGPYFVLLRTSTSPAAADRLGSFLAKGKDSGGNDTDYAGYEARIIDPTDTSEDGEFVLSAMIAGTLTDVLKIGNGVQAGSPGYPGAGSFAASGSIKSTGATAGIGYATGAGGTVTQITSKATGVTLNKATGQITMDAASLAANTTVSFVLTNSAIAAGDTLILNHISGGTAGSYTLNARSASGSATIDVRNVTAGALAEAIVIAFAVIKAVTS
jgi:hypothetical protein